MEKSCDNCENCSDNNETGEFCKYFHDCNDQENLWRPVKTKQEKEKMKRKFKVGDKVRYIEKGSLELKHNKIYTVSGRHQSYGRYGINLEGCNGFWYESRFELVEEEEEYKVAKLFTVYEIAQKDPCKGEFIKFIKELAEKNLNEPNAPLSRWNCTENTKLSNYPTLLRNLTWMEANLPGRIVKVEKKKETPLEPGMRLMTKVNPNGWIVTENYQLLCVDSGVYIENCKERTLEKLNDLRGWGYPFIIRNRKWDI